MYDRDEIELSPNPDAPVRMNPRSLHDSGEFFNNYDSHPSQILGILMIRLSRASIFTVRRFLILSLLVLSGSAWTAPCGGGTRARR